MLPIRSVTVFADSPSANLGAAARSARDRLASAGYAVQSLRLAIGPFAKLDLATALELEARALDAGFDYVSLGQLPPEFAAELIPATQAVFCSSQLAAPGGAPQTATFADIAAAVLHIANATELGFGNLRYCASACVAPGAPFFPAAYHQGGTPSLAIAAEAAGLALESFRADPSTASFTAAINQHGATFEELLADIEAETGVSFSGSDWSLAPHPAPERSAGAAVEALTGLPFGSWGTLAAVRSITAAIRAADVRRVGFSGVMLPVLEDATLAARNAEGRFSLRDLLAFSAVCGTGLDTIPLAGNVSAQQISQVYAETTALATSLQKPLTVRLLPVPGLRPGELTSFTFDYFVNTTAMAL